MGGNRHISVACAITAEAVKCATHAAVTSPIRAAAAALRWQKHPASGQGGGKQDKRG